MSRRFLAQARPGRRSLFAAAFIALFVGTVGGCSSTHREDEVEGALEEDIRGDIHGDHDGTGLDEGAASAEAETEADVEEEDEQSLAAAARIASPVPGKKVTYAYGIKNPRYAAGYHTGQDHAAPTGTKVVAVRNGKIRWSNGNGGAYGNWIGLDADNGRTYVYCHLSSRGVSAGATVKAGQTIGKVGATGNVTGPHLHFEDHPKGPFKYAQVRKPAW